jgi:hypothetical protein
MVFGRSSTITETEDVHYGVQLLVVFFIQEWLSLHHKGLYGFTFKNNKEVKTKNSVASLLERRAQNSR